MSAATITFDPPRRRHEPRGGPATMPDGVLAILGPIGVAIGALLSYLGLRRRQSGTVVTSEAADLWSQTQVLIHAFGERADKLQGQVDFLMQRVDALTEINDGLRLRSDETAVQLKETAVQLKESLEIIAQLREERALLQHEVRRLTESNRALGERVADLTKALNEHRRQLSLPPP